MVNAPQVLASSSIVLIIPSSHVFLNTPPKSRSLDFAVQAPTVINQPGYLAKSSVLCSVGSAGFLFHRYVLPTSLQYSTYSRVLYLYAADLFVSLVGRWFVNARCLQVNMYVLR